jgi:hypothetical protein
MKFKRKKSKGNETIKNKKLKSIIYSDLVHQNYFSNTLILKKEMNIIKIMTSAHALIRKCETCQTINTLQSCTSLKICEAKNVEDEQYFL